MTKFNSLLILTVLANMGMGIIMPVLPVYFKQYGVGALELSGPFVMLVVGRMVSRVFAPSLIARVGHRRAVMSCFAVYAATFAAYLGSHSLYYFSGLRFLEGIVEGLLAVALNDLAIAYTQGLDSTQRTKLMGRFGASFGLGFLLGPLLGSGIAFLFGLEAIFIAGAVLGTAAIGLVAWMVSDAPVAPKPAQQVLGGLGGTGLLLGLYSPQCLRRAVFFSLMILLPLHVTDQLGLGVEGAGLFFAASAVLTTLLMPQAGLWAKWVGGLRAVWSGLLVMAVTIVIMGLTRQPLVFWALFILETIAFALMLPPAMTAFSEAVDNQATRTRILGNMAFATEVISLPLAVILPWSYSRSPAVAWAVVALLCLVALVLFVFSGKALARRAGAADDPGTPPLKAS
ncbi:MAG: MFS transporter [Ramlibacter sp.]|nr:MFS transporter [Ramlibacter sp.]